MIITLAVGFVAGAICGWAVPQPMDIKWIAAAVNWVKIHNPF